MASALKCDRCGRLYEHYQGVEIVEGGNKYHAITLENRYDHKWYDLCPECMGKLIEFIRGDLNKEGDYD